MRTAMLAALAAAATCLAAQVAAQDPPASPATQTPSPTAAPTDPTPAPTPTTAAPPTPTPAKPLTDPVSPAISAAPAAATSAAPAPGSDGPVIVYVKHTQPPTLVDMTPGSAAFGMVGALASIAAGHDLVVKDGIEDPSGDMARALATAYVAAHGGHVADAPILNDEKLSRASPAKLSALANGASYIVDVDPPGMNIIYFSFDWTHFDLLYLSQARIIDASNNKVVAQARCFLKTVKAPDLPTHAQLVADNGAVLKQVIARKTEMCLTKLKTDLKL
jgi:hypothetical protein